MSALLRYCNTMVHVYTRVLRVRTRVVLEYSSIYSYSNTTCCKLKSRLLAMSNALYYTGTLEYRCTSTGIVQLLNKLPQKHLRTRVRDVRDGPILPLAIKSALLEWYTSPAFEY